MLYEHGPFSKIKNWSVELQWRGPLDWWLIGSPTSKHQEPIGSASEPNPCRCTYIPMESNSAPSMLSHCHCTYIPVESDSAPSTLSLLLYIHLYGVRLSTFYAESLCRVHTCGGVRLSKPLLSLWSEGSATLAEFVEQQLSKFFLSWWS